MTWATGLMTQKRNRITAIFFAVLISIASAITIVAGLAIPVSAADQTAQWTEKNNIMMLKRVYKYTGDIIIEGDPPQEKQAYKFTPDSGGCPTYIYFDSKPVAGRAVTGSMASTYDSDGGTDDCKNFPGTTSVKIAAGKVPETGVVTGRDPAPEEMNEVAEPTCDAGGWSWAICPLIESTSEVLQKVNNFISGLSYFTPLPIGTPNDEPQWAIFRAWSVFLTFANIVAVIAFLAIIFSQATSVGISTYGIKKLLPRIIAALILMNLSYYIAALLVDLSNLAGVGVNNLFNAILAQIQSEGNANLYDGGWSDDAFATVIGMGSIGLVIILGGFMVPILIAAFAIFLTLAARIAIIILLVIVAPLAFAAWILPNTEKYFTKWWSLFISMLVLYPLLMAIQGGATLASRILLEVGQNGDQTFDNMLPFIALLVQALPLLAIPFVLKTASGSLGKIYEMSHRKGAQAADSKAGMAARDRTKSYLKFGAFAAGSKLSKAFPGDPDNPSRTRRAGRRISDTYYRARARDRAIQESLEARKQAKDMEIAEQAARLGSDRVSTETVNGKEVTVRTPTTFGQVGGARYSEIMGAKIDEAFNKRVASIKASIDQRPPIVEGDIDILGGELTQAIEGGDAERTAALVGYLSSARGAGGRAELEKVIQNTAHSVKKGSAVHTAINNAINRDNYNTLVSKAGGLAKGGYEVVMGSDGQPVKDSSGNVVLQYNTDLSGLGIQQLATQDVQSLKKNFKTINAANAEQLLKNPDVMGEITDKRVIYMLEKAVANAQAGTPPESWTDITDEELARVLNTVGDTPSSTKKESGADRRPGSGFTPGPGGEV